MRRHTHTIYRILVYSLGAFAILATSIERNVALQPGKYKVDSDCENYINSGEFQIDESFRIRSITDIQSSDKVSKYGFPGNFFIHLNEFNHIFNSSRNCAAYNPNPDQNLSSSYLFVCMNPEKNIYCTISIERI